MVEWKDTMEHRHLGQDEGSTASEDVCHPEDLDGQPSLSNECVRVVPMLPMPDLATPLCHIPTLSLPPHSRSVGMILKTVFRGRGRSIAGARASALERV